MKTWNECCKEVGYNRELVSTNRPIEKHIYYAYLNGNCRAYETLSSARSYSKNVEKAVINKEECDSYWNTIKRLEQESMRIWESELRSEFKELDQDIFNLCYEKAYEESHSSGFDAVFSTMEELTSFAEDILFIKVNSI